MRKIIIESGARNDIREICSYYDERSETAGDRLIDEVDDILLKIWQAPTRFAPIARDAPYRRVNLEVFPYQIVYRVTPRQIRIVLVRHNKRHPNFEKDRLN